MPARRKSCKASKGKKTKRPKSKATKTRRRRRASLLEGYTPALLKYNSVMGRQRAEQNRILAGNRNPFRCKKLEEQHKEEITMFKTVRDEGCRMLEELKTTYASLRDAYDAGGYTVEQKRQLTAEFQREASRYVKLISEAEKNLAAIEETENLCTSKSVDTDSAKAIVDRLYKEHRVGCGKKADGTHYGYGYTA